MKSSETMTELLYPEDSHKLAWWKDNVGNSLSICLRSATYFIFALFGSWWGSLTLDGILGKREYRFIVEGEL
jgi:hypothetical protein